VGKKIGRQTHIHTIQSTEIGLGWTRLAGSIHGLTLPSSTAGGNGNFYSALSGEDQRLPMAGNHPHLFEEEIHLQETNIAMEYFQEIHLQMVDFPWLC